MDEAMTGNIISHYRIIKKIGSGGMGEVHLAEDTKLERKVALKFLPINLTADKEARERFEREAKAAAALNHPNIVTVHEIGEHEGQVFIAMEYVEGRTLKEMIPGSVGANNHSPLPLAPRPLPLAQILDIATQIASGLAAAHEKGIVHRDVKPQNILVDKNNHVKILDFGLAKLRGVSQLTKESSTLGTVHYMSPEQTMGKDVDQRTDIWSLGVVIYEMLTGKPPFKGDYEQAVIYSILNEEPKSLAGQRPDIPSELQAIVGKCLEKEIDVRYQHADDLIADLKRAKRDSKPLSAPAPRLKTARKRRLWPVAGMIMAVAVITLLIFLFSPFKMRVGPSESAQAKENSLAVMYFENLQDTEDRNKTAQMITALLTTGLSDSPRYMQVVSSQRLFDILKLLGKADLKIIDKTVASEVAAKANVQWMVTGKLLKEEPNIVVVSEISDAATGRILATQKVNGAPGEDLFTVVDKLSPQVVKALALPEQAQKELERPISETTTRSQDAFRFYVKGVDNLNKKYFNEAERDFKIALEIDPTFALAYYRLAFIQLSWGNSKKAKGYISEALERSEKMSRKEKLYAEATAADIDRKYDLAIRIFREITDLYPEEKDAYYAQSAIFYFSLSNAVEAIRCSQKAIDIDPLFKLAYNMLAYASFEAGDREKAFWAINEYKRLAPGEANPYDSCGDLYAWDGQIDAAIAMYEKALAINPHFSLQKIGYLHVFNKKYSQAEHYFNQCMASDNPGTRFIGKFSLPVVPMFEGKFARALEITNELIDVARQSKDNPREEGFQRFNKAVILEERGEVESAIQEAMEGSKYIKSSGEHQKSLYLDYCAFLLSNSGRMAEAEAIVDSLRKESEKNLEIVDIYWRAAGIVALAKNDTQGAVEFLGKEKWARHYFFRIYHLARAYLKSGALDKAAAALEKALNRYDADRFYEPILSVKAYYLLGQAYERSGRKDKAIRNYAEFLDIWKNADPGLPEVADARQRLEKLKRL